MLIDLPGISWSSAGSHMDLYRGDGFPNARIVFLNQDIGQAVSCLKAGTKVCLGFWDVGDDFLSWIDYGRRDLFEAAVSWWDRALPYVQQLKDQGVTDEQLEDLYLVGFNEPVLSKGQTVWLAWFETYRQQIGDAHGIHCAILSYAVGIPPYDYYPVLDPALEQCHISCNLITGHSYFGPHVAQYYGKNQTVIYITDIVQERANGDTTIIRGDLVRIRDEYRQKIEADIIEKGEAWPPDIEVRDALTQSISDLDQALTHNTIEAWSEAYKIDLFPLYYSFKNHLILRCRQLWLYLSKRGWTNCRYADTEALADFVGTDRWVAEWAGGSERGYKSWLRSGIWRRKWHDAAKKFLRFLLADPTTPDAAKYFIDINSRGDLSDNWLVMAAVIWLCWQTRKDFWYWGFMIFVDGSYGWPDFDISGTMHDILYEYIQRMTPGYPYSGPSYPVETPSEPAPPAAPALPGIHGPADGRALSTADWEVVTKTGMKALKLMTNGDPNDATRAYALGVELVVVRIFETFKDRVVTAAQFASQQAAAMRPWYDRGVRYFEVHNEPNLIDEGYGSSWQSGADFGRWFVEVVQTLRPQFPEAKFGFPGLSPGPVMDGVRPETQATFLTANTSAIQQADWIGAHVYWYWPDDIWVMDGGMNWQVYREQFPQAELLITEYSNPNPNVPKLEKGREYRTWLSSLQGVKAAFSFVISASSEAFASETWRDELGALTHIVNGYTEGVTEPQAVVGPADTLKPKKNWGGGVVAALTALTAVLFRQTEGGLKMSLNELLIMLFPFLQELLGDVDLVAALAFVLLTILIIATLTVGIVQGMKGRGWISDGTAGIWVSRVSAFIVVIVYCLTFIGKSEYDALATEIVTMLLGAFTLYISVAPSGKPIYELLKRNGWILSVFSNSGETGGGGDTEAKTLSFRSDTEVGKKVA